MAGQERSLRRYSRVNQNTDRVSRMSITMLSVRVPSSRLTCRDWIVPRHMQQVEITTNDTDTIETVFAARLVSGFSIISQRFICNLPKNVSL